MDIDFESSGPEVSLTESKDSFRQRQCDCCGGRQFNKHGRFHPFMIHWVLNPGLALNELLIGQRVAEEIYFCKQCGGWFRHQGQFVECSACRGFHNAKIWDGCKFGNWMGLVCPDCGAMIPCLLNLTSAVVLVLLYPVVRPLSSWFQPRYRQWAKQRTVKSRQTMEADETFNIGQVE